MLNGEASMGYLSFQVGESKGSCSSVISLSLLSCSIIFIYVACWLDFPSGSGDSILLSPE